MRESVSASQDQGTLASYIIGIWHVLSKRSPSITAGQDFGLMLPLGILWYAFYPRICHQLSGKLEGR